MVWLEEEQEETGAPAPVCDLLFRTDARTLPLDHAWRLSRSVLEHLPWLEEEESAAIHLIHYPGGTAENGPGTGEFPVSRRTRLTLRLPRNRLGDAAALSGRTLDIGGHYLSVGESREKALFPSNTLIARHVIHDESVSEGDFVEDIVGQIGEAGIRIRKVVCGQSARFQLPGNRVKVRSVMVSGLKAAESIALQCRNLGEGRLMGCGIFIPHKGLGQIKGED